MRNHRLRELKKYQHVLNGLGEVMKLQKGCNENGAFEMGADQVLFLDQVVNKSVHFIIIICSPKHVLFGFLDL